MLRSRQHGVLKIPAHVPSNAVIIQCFFGQHMAIELNYKGSLISSNVGDLFQASLSMNTVGERWCVNLCS